MSTKVAETKGTNGTIISVLRFCGRRDGELQAMFDIQVFESFNKNANVSLTKDELIALTNAIQTFLMEGR